MHKCFYRLTAWGLLLREIEERSGPGQDSASWNRKSQNRRNFWSGNIYFKLFGKLLLEKYNINWIFVLYTGVSISELVCLSCLSLWGSIPAPNLFQFHYCPFQDWSHRKASDKWGFSRKMDSSLLWVHALPGYLSRWNGKNGKGKNLPRMPWIFQSRFSNINM